MDGTVVLAYTVRHPDRVRSLAVFEPMFVGNDTSWSDEYAGILQGLDEALRVPLPERPAAFRRALSAADDPAAQGGAGPVPDWLAQRIERMATIRPRWRERGPRELVPPPLVLLIAVGGRTHPGYRAITEWLAQQVPARVEEYPERSHFDPPHLAEVECYAIALLRLWQAG